MNIFLKKWLKKNKFSLLFFTLLVLVVYLNSLGNDLLSDDISSIRNHPDIDKIAYFWKPPYFNLSLRAVIIFLTHKIWGFNPIPYRLPSILFHLGSTWVIFLLISFFFSSPIPFFTASIFAVHPLLTESVTWISGALYSNGAFFFLIAFLAYIWSVNAKGLKVYWLSVLLFFLSLHFTEKLIILPLVLTLYEIYSNKLRNNWRKLIPFWLISGLWGLHLLGLLGPRMTARETIFYQQPEIYNPLIQIPIAITSYLELIFWPKNLTLYHSEMIFSQGEYSLRLIIFIIFLGIIAYSFKRNRPVFFWLSFFIISLLPTLTPFGISWIVAERYVYLGSLGIFVVIALLIQKIGQIFKNKNVSYALLAIILFALSIRTIVRNTDWKNQDTLWLATAKTSPSSPQNHNNLGDLYGRQGDFEKSIYHFKKAIELNPRYADAYHNLGNTYQQIGEIELAIENYQKAIEFGPHLWQSHQNLAGIYFEQEKYNLAEEEMKKAIKINPQNSNLYTNLGIVYLKLNDNEKAKQAFQQALHLNPQDIRARQLLIP